MQKLKVLELFGGIGACSTALKRLNINYEIVDYVEIDKYAVKSFNAIHNTNFEPQDISNWNKDIKVDLIMHGSPCQDFSLVGKQAGGDEGSGTRSSLMYETIRIVEKLRPKYVVWENVKNLLSKTHKHNFDNYLKTLEELGYTNYYQILNAKDYEIPQNRERVFTISILNNSKNFEFPVKQELKLKLKDMLDKEVDEKYYLSEKMINYITADNEKWSGNNKESIINRDIATTINTGEGSRRCDASNYVCNDVENNFNLKIKNATKQGYLEAHEGDGVYITNIDKKRGTVQKEMIPTLKTNLNIGVVVKNLKIRKLTPKECFRLMGFNDEEFERAAKVNSNAQLYKQAGNSIVVNVLQAIFKNLLMKEGKIMEKKDEVKIISYETSLMIDLEKLAKEEPDLFNDLVKDYPVESNTKIIIEVKA